MKIKCAYCRGTGTVSVDGKIGKAIHEYRTKNNLTQEAMAKLLGISRRQAHRWEHGLCDPSRLGMLQLERNGIWPLLTKSETTD